MTWELDISRDKGKTWQTVATKKQAEGCKDTARKYHRNEHGVNSSLCYRIYSTFGQEQLAYFSFNNTSWRMAWLDGNLRPRAEQGGVMITDAEAGASA